jgi:chromosomal replication initiator protein
MPGTPPAEVYPAPFAGSGSDDLPLRLNDVYTFDNFIVGPSNSVAHASAKAVAENPGRAYNPLFIHGSVGLGKTHLLHAVCHEFLRRFPSDRVCFLSCEEFTNEFVRSLQRNDVDSFRARFRNVHLLVIDDIHFLKGKERTQEEFFHTFNGLYQSNRQIVLSSDAAPNEIPTLEERLVSRFHWGLVSQLEQPEMETRMAIVRRKAELMGIDVPNDAVEYIASNFRNNIRELEGALLSTKAHADVVGRGISLRQAKAALRGNIKPRGAGITLDKITQMVCREYDVKDSDLRSKRRVRSVSEPRQMIMFIARQLTKLSLDEIGDHFGGRDHSTVLYAVRKTERRYASEPALAATIDRLVDRLGGRIEASQEGA